MGLKSYYTNYADQFRAWATKMNFAAIPTTAQASSMVKNPIDDALDVLSKNPSYKKVGSFEYVAFGKNDDVDEVLKTLKSKSSTHSGIINRKSKMVAGDRLLVDTMKGGKAEFDVFSLYAGGGLGKTLENEWKKITYYYETYGACGILVKKTGKKINELRAISPLKMRVGKLNSSLEIDHFVLRPTFSRSAGKMFAGTERRVDVLSKDKDQSEFIIYVSNPNSDNDFYGVPNYIGAFSFIEADYKFGVTIHNAAENGFQPKVSATFIGRNMTDLQKSEHAEKFKSNFFGADTEIAIVNYVRTKEEMPQIDKLDISNLDRTISVMAELNDSKILTAHSVTNPALFGVNVSGKLGNTGMELETAYNIFRTTEMLPNRKLLLDALSLAFTKTTYEGITFKVEDIPVAPQENRGNEPQNNKQQ